jgi:ABC-type uncharacterized transport system ATPase subunit
MIATDGLTKLYGDFAAIRDLSFAVRPGEVMGFVVSLASFRPRRAL